MGPERGLRPGGLDVEDTGRLHARHSVIRAQDVEDGIQVAEGGSFVGSDSLANVHLVQRVINPQALVSDKPRLFLLREAGLASRFLSQETRNHEDG